MKVLLLPLAMFAISLSPVAQDTTKPDIPAMINQARVLRELMQADPHRPIYHFVAPEGHAMPFDPNGAIYWKGKYHLGYIYQKYRAGKYEHVWGHAVSTDLFHWTLYSDMLNIQDGDMEKGIFSGGTFMSKEGVPHIMYHGEGASANMVAYSKDEDLKVWKKFEGNPVLKTPTSDPFGNTGKYTAWDPEGWYDAKAGYYYQISGGKTPTLFKSKDMYQWEYISPLLEGNKSYLYKSEDVSCPDFFSIGNKSMLLFISHNIGAQYFIGTFANDHFSIEEHGRMNWPGGTFFAPEQLRDEKGRNIIWGWVLERKPEQLKNYGWSGIMSLPRVLSLGKNNQLQIHPPKEVEAIRTGEIKEDNIVVPANAEKELQAKGTSLEIKLELAGGTKSPYGVKVFCSPDGKEETAILYDPVKKQIVINFIKSSASGNVQMPANAIFGSQMDGFPEKVSEQSAPFALAAGETLQLDIFIDRSIIEVFANGRQCITQVVYPQLPNSTGIKICSGEEKVTVKKAQVYTMAATNAY